MTIKLTPAMMQVLKSVNAEGRCSSGGVTRSTIKALIARGLLECVDRPAALMRQDLMITYAGRAALANFSS